MATRKKFIDIELPLLEDTIQVLGTSETLAGKTIKIDLSRRLRGKSLEAVFKIYNDQDRLYGLPKNLNLMKFYITRMMRKRISYVEDSFVAKCKDAEVTIKPFLITRKRVSRAVRSNLRKTSKEFILGYIKDKGYFDICKELVIGQFQKEMLPKLKKVYPLSFCEIRIFETKQLDNIPYTYTPFERVEHKKAEIIQEEDTQADEVKKELEVREKETESEAHASVSSDKTPTEERGKAISSDEQNEQKGQKEKKSKKKAATVE